MKLIDTLNDDLRIEAPAQAPGFGIETGRAALEGGTATLIAYSGLQCACGGCMQLSSLVAKSGTLAAAGGTGATGPAETGLLLGDDVQWPTDLNLELEAPQDLVTSGGGGNGVSSSRSSFSTFNPVTEGLSGQSSQNLLGGSKWGGAMQTATPLTYSLGTSSSVYAYNDNTTVNRFGFVTAQNVAAVQSINSVAAVSGVTFTALTDSSTQAGDIRFMNSSGSSVPTAYAYYPTSLALGGDIWFGTQYASFYQNPTVGSYGYATFIHELGHAMGLRHPHQPGSDGGTPTVAAVSGEDQLKYSVMSYRSYADSPLTGYSGEFYPTTYMLNDILALQSLYGVNTSYNNGNTVYSWNASVSVFETIWDGGGTDTISASTQAQGSKIFLTPGKWSEMGVSFWNGQNFVRDTLTIAYGAVIENATGSAFADTLEGNQVGNVLTGGEGNDSLIGLGGADTLTGGGGTDTLVGGDGNDTYTLEAPTDVVQETGPSGDVDQVLLAFASTTTYTLTSGIENATVTASVAVNVTGNSLPNNVLGNSVANNIDGGQGNDTLDGAGGNDTLTGNIGDDRLVPGTGVDLVIGGTGSDTVVLTGNFATYTITRPTTTDVLLVNAALSQNVTVREAEFVLFADGQRAIGTLAIGPSPGNDTLTGDADNNLIDGLAGNDSISGQEGNDTLIGGIGIDTLVGGPGDDVFNIDVPTDAVVELDGQGYDRVEVAFTVAATYTLPLAVEGATVTAPSTVAVNLVGNGENNNLAGNGANNSLVGGLGGDFLDGGAGQDTLDGGAGFDQLRGGLGNDALVGGNDEDMADYSQASGPVTVNLVTGLASGADGNDTLVGVEQIAGSAYGDSLTGGSENTYLDGGDGNDTLNGGDGFNSFFPGPGNDVVIGGGNYDTVYYFSAFNGINVNLATGIVTGEGTDTLSGIEAVYGTFYDDTLVGNDQDNRFTPDAGTDAVDGGGGWDTVQLSGTGITANLATGLATSGAGSVTLVRVEALVGRDGDDTLVGDALPNSLQGGKGNDSLLGSAGNDALYGDAGNDTLQGGDNDDYLVGGEGNDLLDGGLGMDQAEFFQSSSAVEVDLAAGTAFSSTEFDQLVSIEVVYGSTFNDTLLGDANANVLYGREGNDTLDGGGQDDRLVGGLGNDVLTGGSGIDTAEYGWDAPAAAVNVNLGTGSATGGAGIDTLSGIENLNGTPFNDTLAGDANANVLQGADGNDSIGGAAGNDTLSGGTGIDTLDGGGDADTVNVLSNFASYARSRPNATDLVLVNPATSENLTLRNVEFVQFSDGTYTLASLLSGTASPFNDTLSGDTANNLIDGLAGNDSISGLEGNDTLIGGPGNDTLVGGKGNDVLVVDVATDVVVEEQLGGTDTVNVAYTAAGSYTLPANVENATVTAAASVPAGLVGNTLSNRLVGNAANNNISGGDGDDTLDGGAGNDVMAGGPGNDFYFVDTLSDVVNETAAGSNGSDAIELHLAAAGTYTLPAGIETLVVGGTGTLALRIVGNELGNTITGGLGNETLEGGAGYDLFVGGQGNDSIVGGADGGSVDYEGAFGAVSVNLVTGLVTGGEGNDTLVGINDIYGSVHNDSIVGNDQANFLESRAGDDTLDGGAGSDGLLPGLGNDSVIGGSDVDWVYLLGAAGVGVNVNLQTQSATGEGNDTLIGIENVLASNFADTLVGNGQDNVFAPGGGNDFIDGGAGNDVVQLGSQSFNVNLATGLATRPGETDTLQGIENVTTGSADDTLIGDGNNNVLTALSGNDSLAGGAGFDNLYGGEGNDSLYGEADSDFLAGGNGSDLIDGGSGFDTMDLSGLPAAVTVDLLAGTAVSGTDVDTIVGIEQIYGSSFNDSMTGDAQDNTLRGGNGNDTLLGGEGNDALEGGYGNDSVVGGGGVDSYLAPVNLTAIGSNLNLSTGLTSGDAGIDTLVGIENLVGGMGPDTIAGDANANALTGGKGNDQIGGGGGADNLFGGTGNDSLDGGTGNDTLSGGGDTDTADGGTDSDTLVLGANLSAYAITRPTASDLVLTRSGETVTARNIEFFQFTDGTRSLVNLLSSASSPFDDTLIGDDNNNVIDGLAGNDSISGLGGNDTLIGGPGNDTLVGGKGNDLYGIDVLTDSLVELPGEGIDSVNVGLSAAGTFTLPANVDNATVTAAAAVAVNLTGNDLNNVLTGHAAANSLSGGAGDDTLDGGAGVDTLTGGAGNDFYIIESTADVVNETAAGSSGIDRVELRFIGAASYTLPAGVENLWMFSSTLAINVTGNADNNDIIGNAGNNSLSGLAGNDTLYGGEGNDTLLGGDGNDILTGAAGNDSIVGGTGFNLFSYNDAPSGINANLVTGIISGGDGIDTVSGVSNLSATGFADSLLGSNASEFFDGRNGNDTIDAADGNDTVMGGQGNDSAQGGSGFDQVSFQEAQAGVNFNMGTGSASGEGTDTLLGFEAVLGSLNNDTLTGSDGDNEFDGNAGNDSIVGGLGNDRVVYWVNAAQAPVNVNLLTGIASGSAIGTDTLAGIENITGTLFNDTLTGDGNANNIDGWEGNDLISGGAGIDYLSGSAGNDTLQGDEGNDTLLGGEGNDSLVGGTGFDEAAHGGASGPVVVDLVAGTATGAAGNDTLVSIENASGSSFNDTLGGTDSTNQLFGNDGNDSLVGLGANDSLWGGNGNDLLDGGTGNDQLRGDRDNDTIVGGDGNDYITGGLGNDSIVGGKGSDTADYFFDETASAIVVNLNTGTATGGGGIDTLVGIENVNGSNFNDSLIGDANNNVLEGRGGNDTLIGGAGGDTLRPGAGNDIVEGGAQLDRSGYTDGNQLSYSDLTGNGVTVNLSAISGDGSVGFGTVLDGTGGTDTVSNVFYIVGTNQNDSILGSGAAIFEMFQGLNGDDTIDGGPIEAALYPSNANRANYVSATGSITVDLQAGTATGAAGNDTLLRINQVRAGDFADTLRGSDNAVQSEQFEGRAGNDLIDGRGGVDIVRHDGAPAGVFVDLTAGTAQDGHGGTDTLVNIEGAYGGSFDDVLIGNSGNNELQGRDGNDTLVGGQGDDTLSGGNGIDWALYIGAGGPVTVDLTAGAASGADGNDVLFGIQRVGGSDFSDTLTGEVGSNVLEGNGGNDLLQGLGGQDTLVGGAGNDTLDGGTITDRGLYRDGNWVSYSAAPGPVSVNLGGITGDGGSGSGTASDGQGGTDTLININWVLGSDFGDSIVGSSATLYEQFEGGLGNDTIDGGALLDLVDNRDTNRANYFGSPAAVTVDLQAGTASGGSGNDTLSNITQIAGSTHDDVLLGSNESRYIEHFIGNAGNDTIDGRGGEDWARYDNAPTAVTVVLGAPGSTITVNDGYGTVDTLSNIEHLRGSAFGDSLVGTARTDLIERFQGLAGNDTIDGLGGTDLVYYLDAPAAVVVTLGATGTASDGYGGTDTLRNIEQVRGSLYNDTLTGSNAVTLESFDGRQGNDSIDGLGGPDVVDYYYAWNSGANVDLAANTASNDGFGGSDILLNIENVRGAENHADTISGNNLDNQLDGAGGNDLLRGQGGNDSLLGGTGNDTLIGGTGNDTLAGGAGDDTYEVDNAADVVNETVAGSGGSDTVNVAFIAAGTYTLAAGIESAVVVNALAVNLSGDAGANSLTGGSGNNLLQGNGGNDTLRAGTGVDTLDGGADSDTAVLLSNYASYTLSRPTVTDLLLVNTSTGESVTLRNVENVQFSDITKTAADLIAIAGSPGNDTLTGDDNANLLDGGAGNDSIVGLGGNDTLIGGTGIDTLVGGTGDDTLGIDVLTDVVTELPGEGTDQVNVGLIAAGTYTLPATIENATVTAAAAVAVNLVGNDLDNRLVGHAANNNLNGGLGNDTLDGGAGVDTLVGGPGNDTYIVDNPGDVITELADQGNDDFVLATLAAAGTYALSAHVERAEAGAGTLAINITGNASDNVLTGNAGNNVLLGGPGNDGLFGNDGNDSLDGGTGADRLVGGAGNDTMDGGAILDRVRYSDSNTFAYTNAPAGINANLSGITGDGSTGSGTVQDGQGGTDVVRNVHYLQGSNFNDTILGSTALIWERFRVDGGNDNINGGAITDTLNFRNGNHLSYATISGSIVVDLAAGTATGAAGIDTLSNINGIRGGTAADTLRGSDSAVIVETFDGFFGADLIDGRGGFDIVEYGGSLVPVNVNLATGLGSDGTDADTLVNIEGVIGSTHNDTLTGGNPANGTDATDDTLAESFEGNYGNDTIDGGQGHDRVEFSGSLAGVNVTLNDTADGTASDGLGGIDTLRNIEAVRGSSFNDTLTGSDTAPFESFEGAAGNDSINGRGGIDRADYFHSPAGVNANLGSGVATDGWGGNDTLAGIENLRGSRDSNDTLTGSATANKLEGLGGNDSLAGGAGNDTLAGGTGVDTLDGDADSDTVVVIGTRANFTLSRPNATDLVMLSASTQENLTLRNVESVQFADGLFTVLDLLSSAPSPFNDTLIGTEGNDAIDGQAGNDSISGLGGNDTLIGGTGNDTLVGGKGDDVYGIDVLTDVVSEALNGGTDTVNVGLSAAGSYTLPAEVENATVTAAAAVAVNLVGNVLNNVLIGNAAANNLGGAAGNDTLDGGLGNDTLAGGAGNDLYVLDNPADVVDESSAGSDGNDIVELKFTAAGVYTMPAGVETAQITATTALAIRVVGNNLSNSITGGSGNETLEGGSGSDFLLGGLGNDLLSGGTEPDYVIYSAASGPVSVNLNTGVVTGADGNDTLSSIESVFASSFGDSLVGNADNNLFDAGSGNDTIEGGAGSDVFIPGLGDDRVLGGSDTDTVRFDSAANGVVVNLQTQSATGQGNDTLIDIENIWGSGYADALTGDGNNNLIRPESGNDTIDGAGGIDTLQFSGPAVYADLAAGLAQDGTDTDSFQNIENLIGGKGNDTLLGDGNANTLGGGVGNDSLDGGAADDTLQGNTGSDTLIGGTGIDAASYADASVAVNASLEAGLATIGADTDTLQQIEQLIGSPFNDTLAGAADANRLDAGAGNDSLLGASGNDALYGEQGNDTLQGGDDNDTLVGGLGNDSLLGGAGVDTADYLVEALAGAINVNLATGLATGASGSDTLAGIENVEGSNFNDTLTGDDNANLLRGQAGNDSLSGAGGNDTLVGGSGNDTADGGAGLDLLVLSGAFASYTVTRPNATDIVFTGGGQVITSRSIDSIQFSDVTKTMVEVLGNNPSIFNDTLFGDDGNNLIDALAGDDSISGLGGNDTLIGGAGIDTLIGAAGDDVYGIDVLADVVVEAAGQGDDLVNVGLAAAGTYTLPANVERATVTSAAGVAVNLVGNELDNVLIGNAAANNLSGGIGNDDLDGGAGIDTLAGGLGDDDYFVDNTGDVVIELPDQGELDYVTVSLPAAGTYVLAANIETGAAGSGTVAINITGNGSTNSLFGNAGSNVLLGAGGGDFLIGYGGNDTLDGGAMLDRINYTDGNIISYRLSPAGINANLAGITGDGSTGQGTVQDGYGGTDVVRNLYYIQGSASFNDTIVGSSALIYERFRVDGGDDFVNGGAITDTLNFRNSNQITYPAAAGSITVDLQAGTVTGAAGNDTLININIVRAGLAADTLLGSDSSVVVDFLDGYTGADLINGRGGFDIVEYSSVFTSVNVNLATGQGFDGADFDTLQNIEGVIGSFGNDTLTGGLAANGIDASDDTLLESFEGAQGNDTIDGGQGHDRVEYTRSAAGVNVTLNDTADGSASDGWGGTDVLRNIEAVRASSFNDTLTGSDSAPFESFEGAAGNDSINGRGGIDRADYFHSPAGVNANLANGVAADGWGGSDTLLGIEHLRGSRDSNDTLTGNAGANKIEGLGGNDSLAGGAGNDTLAGGTGVDTIDGGADSDRVLLAGNFAGYTITRINATDTTFVNAGTGENLTLRSIETLQFADGDRTIAQIWGNNPTNFNDILVGTSGNDNINSLAGDDSVAGLEGNDTLNGGTGIDTLVGGQGDDVYNVDNTADVVVEIDGQGSDEVQLAFAGGTVSYTLSPFVEKLSNISALTAVVTVIGNEQANWLVGNASSETLSGGAGNDTLEGVSGTDSLLGGAGDDVYRLTNTTTLVNETAAGSSGYDTVQLSLTAAGGYTLPAGVEAGLVTPSTLAVNLAGNALDNLLTGNEGSNALAGAEGADSLLGAGGNDVLTGGIGNDTLRGGSGNDNLAGDADADLLDAGTGVDTVDGGLGNDTLVLPGDYAAYTVTRLTATDTRLVNTTTGENITLRGVESFSFTDGTRTLAAVWGSTPTPFDDVILGTVGADSIDGLAGNDSISALGGNDTLTGGAGNDTLLGGADDDTYNLDVVTDVVVEQPGEGVDRVNLGLTAAATYVLPPEVEVAAVTAAAGVAVNVTGNDLDNLLIGNAANNLLVGLVGSDALDGGAGIDTLVGGPGDDAYYVDVPGDVITEGAGAGEDHLFIALAAAGTYTVGANVEHIALTNTLAVNVVANPSDNIIEGNIAANSLNGVGGADAIYGRGGNDTLLGGEGNDTLRGEDGNDSLLGEGGDDRLELNFGSGNDTADGGTGNDTVLLPGPFASYVMTRPNATDTLLTGGGQVHTLRNIEGVVFTDGSKTIGEVWGNVATAYTDSLVGTDGDDQIDGLAGDDTLTGFGGNDTLIGGLGNDTLVGGKGNDLFVVDAAGDVLVEEAGSGLDRVNVVFPAAGSYVLGNHVEQGYVLSAAAVAVNLTGNASDNLLVGNAAANILTGGDGNDTLTGGAGIDTLQGGSGDDTYDLDVFSDVLNETAPGSSGNDTARLTTLVAGSYTLPTGVENLEITAPPAALVTGIGNTGANRIGGHAGPDSLSGLEGDDTLAGGGGNDTIDGGIGNDLLRLPGVATDYGITRPSATQTLFSGPEGTVLLSNTELVSFNGAPAVALASLIAQIGSPGNDTLTGGNGSDTLAGGLGNDSLDGGSGADTLAGDSGNDTLVGGADSDILDGGDGSDTYTFNIGGGLDVIEQNDTVPANVDAIALGAGITAGNVTFSRGYYGFDDLVVSVTVGGNTEQVVVVNFFLGDGINPGTVDQLRLTLGTASTLDDVVYTQAQMATAALQFDGGGHVFVGYAGNDTINGDVSGVAADWMNGGGGNDSLTGLAGNDTLFGGNGNDAVNGGEGADWLAGGDGADTLTGGSGNDVLSGGGGADRYVFGFGAGQDTIHETLPAAVWDTALVSGSGPVYTISEGDTGRAGEQDLLVLGSGVTTANLKPSRVGDNLLLKLDGSSDQVEIVGYFGNGVATIEQIVFPSGAVWTSTSIRAAVIVPTAGDDTLIGYLGADNLVGLSGNDLIDGREGHDVLYGGEGNDTLTGGTGNDRFVFSGSGALNSVDLITDFTPGGDRIVLSASNFTALAPLLGTTIDPDLDGFIGYNPGTGELSYDADGEGTGAPATVFALLGLVDHPAALGLDIQIGA